MDRLLVLCLLLTACADPALDREAIADPDLAAIVSAYVETVERTIGEPGWHSGFWGNVWVNAANWAGGDERGLCWQWKQRVHAGVAATVAAVGWRARGVVINRQTIREHHSVVVFDPGVADERSLLEDPIGEAYVLDPWPTGGPDVYSLADWLARRAPPETPPTLHRIYD